MVVRGIWVLAAGLLAPGCSGGSDIERSSESFCTRYQELADSLDVSSRTIAPVEQASSEEILELADRAPGEELDRALHEIAELQPEVLAFIEGVRDGEASPDDYDADKMEQYVRAGRVVHAERHSLCD